MLTRNRHSVIIMVVAKAVARDTAFLDAEPSFAMSTLRNNSIATTLSLNKRFDCYVVVTHRQTHAPHGVDSLQ